MQIEKKSKKIHALLQTAAPQSFAIRRESFRVSKTASPIQADLRRAEAFFLGDLAFAS